MIVVVILFAWIPGCAPGEREDLSSIPLVHAPSQANASSHVWFQDEGDNYGKYGLRRRTGEIVVPPTYDDVRAFSEGLAAVNIGAVWDFPGIPDGGKWGYIDIEGELVIPMRYEFANKFSDGLANVSDGRGTNFIDMNGEVKIRLPASNAGNFREGLAPVYRDGSSQGQDWITDYIDKKGAIVFSIPGYGREFHHGLAVFSVTDGDAISNENRSYGYINKSGQVVIQPKFGEASRFSGRLAAVRKKKTTVYGMGDSWGYIDPSGEYVVSPDYNEAHPFRDGKAMVHEGGELMIVEDGPSYWEGGTWWLIDEQGTKKGKVVR